MDSFDQLTDKRNNEYEIVLGYTKGSMFPTYYVPLIYMTHNGNMTQGSMFPCLMPTRSNIPSVLCPQGLMFPLSYVPKV